MKFQSKSRTLCQFATIFGEVFDFYKTSPLNIYMSVIQQFIVETISLFTHEYRIHMNSFPLYLQCLHILKLSNLPAMDGAVTHLSQIQRQLSSSLCVLTISNPVSCILELQLRLEAHPCFNNSIIQIPTIIQCLEYWYMI